MTHYEANYCTLECMVIHCASYGNTINVCNSCSYKTLKSAIAAAKDGDTIVVKKGLYKEGNIILDKQIVLLDEDNLFLMEK